jgi:hypothetical protein
MTAFKLNAVIPLYHYPNSAKPKQRENLSSVTTGKMASGRQHL